jgi:hypothetical protein
MDREKSGQEEALWSNNMEKAQVKNLSKVPRVENQEFGEKARLLTKVDGCSSWLSAQI